MTEVIRAPRLRPGDAVGIVSPSFGAAGRFPHRIEQAISHLKSLDFGVKIAGHALNQRGVVSDSAEHRAQDIHDMFLDPEVKAIIAAIGGDHSCHLLPLLDFDLIGVHPTVFMGYSDITVLNIAIWQSTGLITFNGPAIMTDFAEQPRMFNYTEHYFLQAVTRESPIGLIEPSTWWTEEFQDWEQESYRFPIITDMDFGHTAPQFTLPLGCRGRIDSQQRRFEIIDPTVA